MFRYIAIVTCSWFVALSPCFGQDPIDLFSDASRLSDKFIRIGKVYWTDESQGGNKIRRANLDGSSPEDVLAELMTPIDLALDQSSQVVPVGLNQLATTGGGSSVTGGIDYLFQEVAVEGILTADYIVTPLANVDPGLATTIDFLLLSDPTQFWDMNFTGEFNGTVQLTIAYDDSNLIFPESAGKYLSPVGRRFVGSAPSSGTLAARKNER